MGEKAYYGAIKREDDFEIPNIEGVYMGDAVILFNIEVPMDLDMKNDENGDC